MYPYQRLKEHYSPYLLLMCCFIIPYSLDSLYPPPPTSSLYLPPSPPTHPSTGLPGKTRPSCSHHVVDVRNIGLLSVSMHRSRMGQVSMYCVTMLCCLDIYVPISSSPSVVIAPPKGGYFHTPWSAAKTYSLISTAPSCGGTSPKASLFGGSPPTSPTQTVGCPGRP